MIDNAHRAAWDALYSADSARRIIAADRRRLAERKRRARQRRAQAAARWLILAAGLAALGLAGYVESLTP